MLPLPLSVPDVAASTSQALLADAVHVTGRAQVPVSFKMTVCVVAVDWPCDTENARLADEGGDSTQGGRTVTVTENVWGLPCTVAPLASLAAMVTFEVYVPVFSPARLAVTAILPD